jgi:hypothetical protein
MQPRVRKDGALRFTPEPGLAHAPRLARHSAQHLARHLAQHLAQHWARHWPSTRPSIGPALAIEPVQGFTRCTSLV